MKKYSQLVLLGLLVVACHQELETEHYNLSISAEPLEGEFFKLNGKTIIKSPNTLQHENYFVWGGSVIKGKDGKYHMLFSLWESGEKWAPFQDGWLINSKIAYAVSDYPNKEFEFQKPKGSPGKITGSKPGLAILVSSNGINWQKPANSFFMKKELLFTNGQRLDVSNFERPQIFINKDGSPSVLYCACSVEPVRDKKDGSTFNVQIFLNKKK